MKEDVKKMVIEHIHSFKEEEEDNEDDEGKGSSPSIHKGGSNLSQTGGQIPLYAPKRNTIDDPTEKEKSARDIIDVKTKSIIRAMV